MELAGLYVFSRHDYNGIIGVLDLKSDGSIEGGSVNELFWDTDGGNLYFKNAAGTPTSQFAIDQGNGNYAGIFLLPYEAPEPLKHFLRRVRERRTSSEGPLARTTRNARIARQYSESRTDFSVSVAPSGKVRSVAHVADFTACETMPRNAKKFLADSYKAPEVFFHVLHDAVLYNGTIVQARDDRVIHETTYQCSLRSFGLKHAAREDGSTIYLPCFDRTDFKAGTWFMFNSLIGNYAHFHMQSLANIDMLADAKTLLGTDDIRLLCVSLPGHTAGQHYEQFRPHACTFFGLDIEQMVNPLLEDGVALRFERLIVPSPHAIPPEERFNPYLVETLRRKMVTRSSGGRRRLLLSRADVGNSRSIANFDALETGLQELGFESLVIGSLGYTEQLEAMADAAIVVSAHGGNLTNTLAHPGGLKIVELTHSSQLSTWFKNLAALSGHDYSVICSSPMEDHWYSSFEVDVRKVVDHVRRLL